MTSIKVFGVDVLNIVENTLFKTPLLMLNTITVNSIQPEIYL